VISETNINKAKEKIKSSKEKPIIVKAQSIEFNRKILEHGRFDILLGIEYLSKTDKIKQLSSGLNHVLAKIAAKNKIAIGVDISQLKKLEKKQKAVVLARIRQNVKICRKAKCKIKLLNYNDKKSAQFLLLTLGASTQQAKEAITF